MNPAWGTERATPGRSGLGPTTTLLPLLPPPDVAVLPKVWAYSGSASRRPPSRAQVGLTLAVALLVLAGALGFVLTRHRTPAVALSMSMASGQRMRYEVRFELDARQSTGHATHPLHRVVSTTRSWRVLKVDTRGVATVLERSTVVGAILNGHPVPKSKPAKARLEVAPDGHLLTGGSGILVGNGQGVPPFGGFGPVLPDRPVRPGDSWDMAVVESLPGGGTIHGALHGTLLRYETDGGVRLAVVATSLVLPLDFTTDLTRDPATARAALGRALRKGESASLRSAGRMTVHQTAWFDPDNGLLVRSSVSGHLDYRTTVTTSGKAAPSVRLLGDFSVSTAAVSTARTPTATASPAKGS